jgi:ribonuclease I
VPIADAQPVKEHTLDPQRENARYAILPCLDRHEWIKHGTRSGLSSEDYYRLSLDLAAIFTDTELARYVADHVGHRAKRRELLLAFERDFGPGSRRHLQLRCSRINGLDMLTEVHVYLRRDRLKMGEPHSTLLAERPPKIQADCPSRFHIDSPGDNG